MTAKGSWTRPRDEQKWSDGYDRIFGKREDALKSDSTDKDRYYEEASDLSEEMKLHHDKMDISYFLKEQGY